MLCFRICELKIGGLHFILQPKLNVAQLGFLRREFERKGFSVEPGERITARRRGESLHLEPCGYCWSSGDPADLILPMVPDLLSFPKEGISQRSLEGMYFRGDASGERGSTRVYPRLESYTRWERLRKDDGCGMAPDESLVCTSLMGRSSEPFPMVTDYLTDGAVPVVWGRRRYFETSLPPEEASRTLRSAVAKGVRNSYLPRDGLLLGRHGPANVWDLAEELGEWCFYTAS